MRPPRPFMRRPRVRENVNEAIRFREVRAVFPDGTTAIMSTSEAIARAKDIGLDLILIAPTAQPPVAKAMDYGQWQYEEKKKKNEAKKKQHVILVKEVKFRPNTDDHDYNFKKNNAIRFLKEGNRVKAMVQFRGREIAHSELGKRLLERLAADLAEVGQGEGGIRMEGRAALLLLSPVKAEKPKSEKSKAEAPAARQPAPSV
ncbi:MAG: translation initiation factor IF-3 [Bryobacterales bacterium]|nr:translation initiation factor IF-3 [Bryobacterales bacterium]